MVGSFPCNSGQTVTNLRTCACNSVCSCSQAHLTGACHSRGGRGFKPQLFGADGWQEKAPWPSAAFPQQRLASPDLGTVVQSRTVGALPSAPDVRVAPKEKRRHVICNQQLQPSAVLSDHQLIVSSLQLRARGVAEALRICIADAAPRPARGRAVAPLTAAARQDASAGEVAPGVNYAGGLQTRAANHSFAARAARCQSPRHTQLL